MSYSLNLTKHTLDSLSRILAHYSLNTQRVDNQHFNLDSMNRSAVIIQGIFRTYQVRSRLTTIPIRIVEARDSHIGIDKVREIITMLARKELESTFAGCLITEDYFSSHLEEGGVEHVFLAMAQEKVLGYMIMTKHIDESPYGGKSYAESGYVSYIVVNSMHKKIGVGTQLMLLAMRTTKQMGKHYLALEYEMDENIERSQARKKFYDSFTHKFKIPQKKERIRSMTEHILVSYDLRRVLDRTLVMKPLFLYPPKKVSHSTSQK
jgi:ribosomal protein S18 acetylase RimI-like enzyme